MSTNDSSSSPASGSDLRSRLAEEYPEVTVWAAGGLVLREVDGSVEVLLVHRPHHDDWSFPKGKIDDGETLGQTAVREVEEETGLRCERNDRLASVRYTDARGREKLVAYWTMSVVSGAFVTNDETDAVGWFDLTSARNTVTYGRDVEVLDALTASE